MNVLEEVKQRIRSRIVALATNPHTVSVRAGLSRTTVSEILNGRSRNPGILTLASIAGALDWEIADLLGRPAAASNANRASRPPAPGNLADAIAAFVDPLGGIEVARPLRRRSHRVAPAFGLPATEEDAA